ncbi:helix-turn-helix transcriptional regulator [Flavobacterium sp.]|uniref:helix-turn-helix transcriptional regulator n=1 Tax=Flavobacterium sp. TaxID=239 RepID=UPI00352999C9
MKQVTYHLQPPNKTYLHLQKSLDATLVDSQFILNQSLGNGRLIYLQIQNGLWAQQLDFSLNESLELLRLPNKENDLFIIDFYLSETELIRKDKDKTVVLGLQNINLVLTSATVTASLQIPATEKVSLFNIIFTKQWLFDNVLVDQSDLHDFFDTNDPIYLSENLDYKLKELLTKIDFEKHNRLTSMSNTIQIIDYLFSQFTSRSLSTNRNQIHPNDLNQLIASRKQIDSNPHKNIPLEELAKTSGMSLSKYKRLFKQVFGITPYQYHLSNKMELAMETLKKQKFSVSETGFAIGYSNLSQFSKAFKNHFGILPREVRL